MTSSSYTMKMPRVHKQTLVEMNMPVFTGRRDVAHARAVAILRQEIADAEPDKRLELYHLCHGLLGEVINATQRSQLQVNTPLLRYLKLLQDTVGLNLALLRHELTLTRETSEISKLVGSHVPAHLRQANAFTPSENHLYTCTLDLVKFGERLFQADTEERQKSFRPDDHRRYKLAADEYDAYYRGKFRPPDA
jgi:hypothetical protein